MPRVAGAPPANATTLPATIEALSVALYEIGVLEEADVLLQQAWLDDLESRGHYAFPELRSPSLSAKPAARGARGNKTTARGDYGFGAVKPYSV